MKIASRKFAITVSSLFALVLQSELSPVQMVVAGCVAVVYVVAQAYVDRGEVEAIASAAERGLAEGRDASDE